MVAVVQFLSCVWFFVTPWTAACQVSLSFTISWSLLKLMSIQSSHPLLPPSPFALNLSSIRVFFQWPGSSHQLAKVLELQINVNPSNEYSVLISFRIGWFDLLAYQGTLKSLLQDSTNSVSVFTNTRSAFKSETFWELEGNCWGKRWVTLKCASIA